jgi:hypothetical protein
MTREKMRRYAIVYAKNEDPEKCYKLIVFATSNEDAFKQFWKHRIIEESWGKKKPYTMRSIKKRYYIVSSDWMDTE